MVGGVAPAAHYNNRDEHHDNDHDTNNDETGASNNPEPSENPAFPNPLNG